MRNFVFLISLSFISPIQAEDFDFNAMESCSIDKRTPCKTSISLLDNSYSFVHDLGWGPEVIFEEQKELYSNLKKRLIKEPTFPIEVILKLKDYEGEVQKKLEEFLEEFENSEFSFLKNIDVIELFPLVSFMPKFLKEELFKQLPLSRFHVSEEAYTEKAFSLIHTQLSTVHFETNLTDNQRDILIGYGAISVLIAQGYIKKVKFLSN